MNRRAYIETYGCAFNFADSETLAALLADEGWRIVPSSGQADVVVLNSCTVKDRTYLDFQKRLKSLTESRCSEDGPAVVVAGCVPRANSGETGLKNVVCIGAADLAAIGQAAEAALASKPFRQVGPGDDRRLDLPHERRNPAVEILPINQGCSSVCAFCQTRLARGRLKSFPLCSIVSRIRQAVDEGVSEIWLTSQDTGSYGADIGLRLPDLLETLANEPGDFKIRLGMSSPQWILRDLERLREVFQSPRFYQFLHVPVQSGDDRVLAAMRRDHTAGDYEEICSTFRERFPRMAIWTDIIAGFPTETDEEFEHSLELLRRTRPATVNRSRFSPRPGTAAARMPQLSSKIISQRSRQLNQTVEEISTAGLKEWVGWKGEVRVSEIKRPGSAVARNFAYRPIILQGDYRPGQRLLIRVTDQTTFHLNGQPLGHSHCQEAPTLSASG